MNSFIDRIIEQVSPASALKRAQSKMALRAYEGASKGRRTAGWKARDVGANNETRPAISILRGRMEDANRNNPIANKAIKVLRHNVIGTGIRPSFLTERNETELQREYTERWRDWAETTACDFDEERNMYALQKLAYRTMIVHGECIVRRRRTGERGKNPIQIQIQEPAVIDTGKDGIYKPDGSYIIQGVQFNKEGKKEGYWLFNHHPDDFLPMQTLTSTFVPKADIIHLKNAERAGQVRGVPEGASALIRLKDLDDLQDAQLMAFKVQACYAVFRTKTDPEGTFEHSAPPFEPVDRITPGMIEELPPGETVSFASPNMANGYSDAHKAFLRSVAGAWGISYEALSGDLSGVNFSSGRMGWLEMQRVIEDWQWLKMVPEFCAPVYEWFVQGEVMATPSLRRVKAEWTPPRREMIDPVKEVKGIVEQVRNGLMTWPEAVRSMGYDPLEVAKEMNKWYAIWDELGIEVDCDAREKIEGAAASAEGAEGAEPTEAERNASLKMYLDAYGVGVRAGTITPVIQDEEVIRAMAGLPAIDAEIASAWQKDGGVRKPITLKGESEVDAARPSSAVSTEESEE